MADAGDDILGRLDHHGFLVVAQAFEGAGANFSLHHHMRRDHVAEESEYTAQSPARFRVGGEAWD